jgi:hypothetical protein
VIKKVRDHVYGAILASARSGMKAEATALGVHIAGVEQIHLERPSIDKAAGRLLKLAAGFETEPTCIQTYHPQSRSPLTRQTPEF